MSDADTVLQIAPLPPRILIPEDAEGPDLAFFRFVAAQFDRHDELEHERRHDEAERRVVYEAERREQNAKIDEIAKSVGQVAEVCAALTHKLAQVDSRLATVEGLMLALRARFDVIATTVQAQGADLHELRLRLDALEAEMGEVKRRLDAYAPTSRPPATDPSACIDPLEPGGES